MGKTKENRINRFKRKRVWPMIFGLFFMLISFAGLICVGVFLAVKDVTNRKLSEGLANSERLVALYDGPESLSDPQANCRIFMDITEEVEEVCLLSDNGTGVWKSGEAYPDLRLMQRGKIEHNGKEMTMYFIMEEKNNLIYFDRFGNFVPNKEMFSNLNLYDIIVNRENKVASFHLWYVIVIEDGSIEVLNELAVYGYEIRNMLLLLAVPMAMIVLFTLYYIFSVIGVVINQRRTTKIIYTDMLTGGNNWLYFSKRGSKLINKMTVNRKYAVVHVRMKKYRSFCMCFGVNKGEELIERLYNLIKKQIGYKEVVAYHEKADFGLLLTYTNELGLAERLENLAQQLERVLPNIKLNIQIGVCVVEKSRSNVEELYNNALLARELHGDDGEQRIAFFNIEMSKQKVWERKVEDDMERALINREFQVYLQPKFSTGDESLGGAEALVRWIHPTEGFVPPNKFIPIFEQNGFILKLDDFMLEEVAKQQAKWISEGWQAVPVSVNVSRAHFTREDLAEHICEIVDKYQVPHEVIELELTESAFFDDKETILSTVKKLREAGFSVSMDDFGAGYSSLNSLKELSLDVLKIDADFFRGTDSLDRGMLIVTEVIDLAKKLNMKIVAEGIESREQVDFLKEQDCDLIQGYYFAKPMPLDEFEKNYKKVGQEEINVQAEENPQAEQ